MKSIITTLFLVALSCCFSQAQKLLISPLTEKTVSGWQGGSIISYQTQNLWLFGVFYQQELSISQEKTSPSNTFYGVTINTPIVKTQKLNFYFNSRTGIVNKNYLVFAPGLETEWIFAKNFSLSTLISMRMSYPSAILKVNIKL